MVKTMLKILAEKKPKIPRMTLEKSAALYMGYYLKCTT